MSRPEVASRLGRRRLAAGAGAVAVLGLAVTAWSSTRLGDYSVMSMGYVDDGRGSGGQAASGHGHGIGGASRGGSASQPGESTSAASAAAPGRSVSVTSLVADPSRPADVRYTLVARQGRVTIRGGRALDGYTLNGTSPGPELHARQGQLVEVTLVNESVVEGTTLHWHGVDVPNASDGVAGVTQDAVPVGGRHVYRFVAEDAGTYWYHSHQMSHEQVERGLLGALVVGPPVHAANGQTADPAKPAADVVALLHVYGGQHTLNGRAGDHRVQAAPGQRVRVRVVNTDMGTAAIWASTAYRVVAVDGREVHRPTDVSARKALVAAGGRLDVELAAPADGSAARLHVGGARSVVVGDGAAAPAVRQPRATLDLLSYGSPRPLGFDASRPDRRFDYVIRRRFGLVDGRPGNYWTINGHLFPDVPMFHVREGDVVRMRIVNRSDEVHPMHLHGHHVVVLERNGVAASGSPWLVDSLDVRPDETYEVAFVADNPGIWSDHCHTLRHATDGLVAHLMYEGVTTPFLVGGTAPNKPE
jgi:FtsP/CotA-like multicopper oxidase with cupredoxin domain